MLIPLLELKTTKSLSLFVVYDLHLGKHHTMIPLTPVVVNHLIQPKLGVLVGIFNLGKSVIKSLNMLVSLKKGLWYPLGTRKFPLVLYKVYFANREVLLNRRIKMKNTSC
jgi:hypothetical protein